MDVLILNRAQVKEVVDMKAVLKEVRQVYQTKAEGNSVIWPLVNHEFVEERAAMDIRSGYIKGTQLHGLKMLNNFPQNAKQGLPAFNGIMMVYDSNTGIPIGILDASYVTCMRTGAAGAIGVDLLARKEASTLMLLGAGKQAPFQIAATLELRPNINCVYIVDPVNHAQAETLAKEIPQILADDFQMEASGVQFLAEESIETATRASDAIITITPSRKALIQKDWVKPGTHFSCLGSDMESKQEIDSELFQGAKIYADDKAQCIRVGEMELPLQQGVIAEGDIQGELGELLLGKIPGRENDQETTIFDGTGLYILDLVTAKTVIDTAKAKGLGITVDM